MAAFIDDKRDKYEPLNGEGLDAAASAEPGEPEVAGEPTPAAQAVSEAERTSRKEELLGYDAQELAGTDAAEPDSDDDEDLGDKLREAGKVASHAALSAAMAATMSAALSAPPDPRVITLDEPVPIVQMYEAPKEETHIPQEDQAELRRERLRRILRMIRWALVAIFLIAAVVFGLLRGCASCSAGILAPPPQEEEGSGSAAGSAQAAGYIVPPVL